MGVSPVSLCREGSLPSVPRGEKVTDDSAWLLFTSLWDQPREILAFFNPGAVLSSSLFPQMYLIFK